MLPRSGIINHQQISSILSVQHEHVVEPCQKYGCHIMQSTEPAENHAVVICSRNPDGDPHSHYN